jgi:2-polyprenyl-6-methoxyphenol hydroxylase-like FAD-dependent oxidoreductase
MIGEHAVVIGAGMGGLVAAAAAAPHFSQVTVLDRDELPSQAAWRMGTPQCRHAHMLLIGGLMAINELLPGFGDDLEAAGAVRTRYSIDIHSESPGYNPVTRRDLGLPVGYMMTRPLLEITTRRRVEALGNVQIRSRTRVTGLDAAAGDVRGVRLAGATGEETLAADLVIDSSGRGQPTLELMAAFGLARPDEDVIGINTTYTSCIVKKPPGWVDDWKAVITLPDPPADRMGAFLFSVEGDCWIVSVNEMHGPVDPTDWAGLLAGAKALRTPTVYDTIKDCQPVSDVVRFRRPQSTRRHFERLAAFPRGLIAFGDAVCQFNPVYGQGMSSSAKQARLLKGLFAEREGAADPLTGIAETFFSRAPSVTDAPWGATRGFDFQFTETTGEKPANHEQSQAFGAALAELVSRDAEVQRLFTEVGHLVKPPSVFEDPAIAGRVMAIMAETRAPA